MNSKLMPRKRSKNDNMIVTPGNRLYGLHSDYELQVHLYRREYNFTEVNLFLYGNLKCLIKITGNFLSHKDNFYTYVVK